MQSIQTILKAQREYFHNGYMRPIEKRIEALDSLKSCIHQNESRIFEALYSDLGKSQAESYMSEIAQIYEEIKAVKKVLKPCLKPKKVKTPMSHFGGKSHIYYEPYGVVLIISPWNYPINLSLIPLIGAIAAGNNVILKPSEYSPASSQILQDIITQAFSKDFVCVIQGDDKMGIALLQERFDYIFFTGSVRIGRIVMTQAAKYLTPITLELGGKNPCIIEDFSHIKTITKRIVWGKLLNLGQTCIAPDILFINHKHKDSILSYLRYHIKQMYLPDDSLSADAKEILDSKDYGKIISKRHFLRARRLLEDLEQKGGKECIIFGGASNETSLKIAPTLIDFGSIEEINETRGFNPLETTLLQEEIFAPILPIFTYQNLASCVHFLKHFPNPLALYIFSEVAKSQRYIIENVAFGGGCINDCIMQVANTNLPFGGVGDSGMGRYHSIHSIESFSRKKSIYSAPTKFDIPLRYPPFGGRIWGMDRVGLLRKIFE